MNDVFSTFEDGFSVLSFTVVMLCVVYSDGVILDRVFSVVDGSAVPFDDLVVSRLDLVVSRLDLAGIVDAMFSLVDGSVVSLDDFVVSFDDFVVSRLVLVRVDGDVSSLVVVSVVLLGGFVKGVWIRTDGSVVPSILVEGFVVF